MELLKAAAALLIGYLLGSVSFAVLISRTLKGEDVRTTGSGNAGMTNMLRSYGWAPAAATLLGDFLKGTAGALLGQLLLPGIGGYLGGAGALLGHTKPVFFGFRGGKGVATALGLLMALEAPILGIILLVGLIVIALTGYVSLGSLCGAALLPVCKLLQSWLQNSWDPLEIAVLTLLACYVIYAHRENIRRLRTGTERRFSTPFRKKTDDKGGNQNG